MDYKTKNIWRVNDEELYHTIKNLEYFYNDLLKDVFIKVRGISMLALDGNTYKQCIDACYPEMEEYEKKYIIEETKLFDKYCDVIKKKGFDFKPNVNTNGFIEIDLIPIKE